MKVVLFCGGMGYRMREHSSNIPKPLATIGVRPVLWHLMKYYCYFGHRDFVLCLGYKGEMIKEYFTNYNEWLSNDFVFSNGGRRVKLLAKDISEWQITFVDTGLRSSIGERLRRVRHLLADEDVFLANYSDNLTDFPLPQLVSAFLETDAVAGILGVKSTASFHVLNVQDDHLVNGITGIGSTGVRINGGCFVFRPAIFDYLHEGEDLVDGCFPRLIRAKKLFCYPYDGFWVAMDTFKDRAMLEELQSRGDPPWEVWRTNAKNNGGCKK